jgi:hypothetical protein
MSAVLPRRSRLRRLPRASARLLQLPPSELLTTLHVVALISIVESLIRWVPLPRLCRLLDCRIDLQPACPNVEQLPVTDLPPRARRQVSCTERVARAWPFGKGNCLRSTLVSGHLLRDLQPTVRLGLRGRGSTLSAHAWLEVGGRPLEPVSDYEPFQHPRPRAAG